MIDSERTCFEAATLLHHYAVASILVVDRDKEPVGVITEKDLVRFASTEKILPSSMKVFGFMSSDLPTIDINSTVEETGRMMMEKKVSSLFVTKAEEVVGMITESDIMRRLLEGATQISINS